jgi:hypothetical protein
MLQQLLADTVLEAETAISLSLSMAGALADQATITNSSSSGIEEAGCTAAAAAAASDHPGGRDIANTTTANSACQLLELAAQLTQYSRQQALQLAQQQAPADSPTAGTAGAEQSLVVQHIVGVQQQVLLRLGQAYLTTQQYAKALDCVTTLQGLSVGCMPVPGIVRLSILALIGQGKLLPAAAQLVAWLKQGSHLIAATAAAGGPGQGQDAQQQQQSTEEACAVVDAFLQALHEHASSIGSAEKLHTVAGLAAGAAAGVDVQLLVRQVADAAAERCQGQPGVAVAVVLRLLANEVRLS